MPGEKLVTLDGIEREFDGEMLLICDGGGPVGIAGIMGGGNSEVSESTKNVLLEVANFRAGSIRRTSTHLKLRTEASLRFEKGIGPEMAEYAQRRALHLFEQLTGGAVAKGLVDVYPGKQPRPAIIVEDERIARVLGIEVPVDDVRRILTDLGFACHFVPPGRYSVQPPDWRPDVEIADDVIEDIGRIHGYDKLPATMLRGKLPEPEPTPLMDLRERRARPGRCGGLPGSHYLHPHRDGEARARRAAVRRGEDGAPRRGEIRSPPSTPISARA